MPRDHSTEGDGCMLRLYDARIDWINVRNDNLAKPVILTGW